MSALLINETFLNTFLRTQKSGFALKSAFLSGFTLLRAFLSAQKSAQGPAQPLCDDDNDGDDNDGDVDDGDDDVDKPHSLLLLSGHSGSGLPLGFHHDLSFLHPAATTAAAAHCSPAQETSLVGTSTLWIHLLPIYHG